jgi:hypothetical protein
MIKANYPLKRPLSTKAAAQFFKQRAGKAKPKDLLWFLENAPAKPPVRGDEKH